MWRLVPLIVVAAAASAASPENGVIAGHTENAAAAHRCEPTPAPSASAAASRADDDRAYPSNPRFRLWPQAGRLFQDLQPIAFMDVLWFEQQSLVDYRCQSLTFDGHQGTDVVLRSLGEMEIGVPVFAPAPGQVLAIEPGAVVIGQPQDRRYTLRNLAPGSVLVSVGEQVNAGRQIGLMGTNGSALGPFLHLEAASGVAPYDAFQGACGFANPSLWWSPPVWDDALRAYDAGVANTPRLFEPDFPEPWSRTGLISLIHDQTVSFWVYLRSLPANSAWTLRLYRADGVLGHESSGVFAGPYRATSSWWFERSVFDLGTAVGTARFELHVNGSLVAETPFETALQPDPSFNRPPNPVEASIVAAGRYFSDVIEWTDVLICEVETDLVNDDPDYDIVRYEYVWTIDGDEVRRITSAALTDVLEDGLISVGQTVRCEVTPSDGRGGVGPSAVAESVVRELCIGDTDGDRLVNFTDMNAVLSAMQFFVQETPRPADTDYSGRVVFADLNNVLGNFNRECP